MDAAFSVTQMRPSLKAFSSTTIVIMLFWLQVYEIVDAAFAVTQMRPSKADVERELASWKVGHNTKIAPFSF